jgi:predicted MPP superfamily phosphohydrolase
VLFPKYDAGLFKIDNHYMIVNRGLGNGDLGFRFLNNPEIGLIILKNK